MIKDRILDITYNLIVMYVEDRLNAEMSYEEILYSLMEDTGMTMSEVYEIYPALIDCKDMNKENE